MPEDSIKSVLKPYLDQFIASNLAARTLQKGLQLVGVGFYSTIDHISFRTLNIEERAKEFLALGYVYDEVLGPVEAKTWWGKVYRKVGYPDIFIDQPYDDERGKESSVRGWVEIFGDKEIHHVAIKADDVEQSLFYLEKQGIPFTGEIVGAKGSDLRQVFTKPEIKNEKNFTVVELTERNNGYQGFLPPQSDHLIRSIEN